MDRVRDFMPVKMGLMVFFGLLFIALVVVGIVLLVKLASRHSTPVNSGMMPPNAGSAYRVNADNARAMEILNERLAKGEIGEEEFDRIKAKLKS
jgi:uncharacterized membrane protein